MGTICPQALAHCYGRRCLQIGEGKLGSEAAHKLTPPPPMAAAAAKRGSFQQWKPLLHNLKKKKMSLYWLQDFLIIIFKHISFISSKFFTSHKQFIFKFCIYYCHKFHKGLFAVLKTNFPYMTSFLLRVGKLCGSRFMNIWQLRRGSFIVELELDENFEP